MGAAVAVFAGSARRDSLNKKLARQAAALATAEGYEARFVDLGDFDLPIYHGDLEAAQGVPPRARDLAQLLAAHDGWIIASPENNTSVSALLKNTLDWLSRIRDLAIFDGRSAALLAASPGAFGGVRGLYHLRAILNSLGTEVLARQFVLPRAHQAFDADGRLRDAQQLEQLTALVRRLGERLRQP